MVYLKIDELLEKQHKTKYWLVKEIDGNYRVVKKMVEKETISIKFDTIDKLCDALNCEPGDLFVRDKRKNKYL